MAARYSIRRNPKPWPLGRAVGSKPSPLSSIVSFGGIVAESSVMMMRVAPLCRTALFNASWATR